MAVTQRRERERQNVRTMILDVARELFAAEGYEAVTMRRVAEAIEYSATTIYLHFKDKDALIRELCRIDTLSLAQALQEVANEPDPLARLRKMALVYVNFGKTHPNHYRLMFITPQLTKEDDLAELGHGNPETDGYILSVNTFKEAIAQQLLLAELTDPEILAQAYWASIHGVVSLHLTLYGDPWLAWRSLEDTAQLVVDTMLRGLQR